MTELVDGRIQALLDDGVQAVDLVDEEDVVLLELRREQRGQRPLVLDDGTARGHELDAHLVRQDVGERGLAEPGRPGQEDVIERLAALPRRLDEDAEVLLVLGLPDVVREGSRPQRAVELGVVRLRRRVDRTRGRGLSGGAARFGMSRGR